MSQEETKIVEAPKQTFSMILTDSLNEVQEALPQQFNITRFVQNSVALLNDNPQLQNFAKTYGTSQIKAGMLKGAYLGLDFMNKEAYLIPYKDKLQFMVDYRGAEKLAKKYSMRPIIDIYAKVVRQGDEFSEEIVNGKPSISFKPIPFNTGAIIGAFAVCLFQDGGMIYDTMSIAELEKTRKSSKASNSPAWSTFTEEMYKKTVLHRLCKHIEIDFENPNQRDTFFEDSQIETEPEKVEVVDIFEEENVVDGEVIESEIIGE